MHLFFSANRVAFVTQIYNTGVCKRLLSHLTGIPFKKNAVKATQNASEASGNFFIFKQKKNTGNYLEHLKKKFGKSANFSFVFP